MMEPSFLKPSRQQILHALRLTGLGYEAQAIRQNKGWSHSLREGMPTDMPRG